MSYLVMNPINAGFGSLDPTIITFLYLVAIIGPICIVALIYILKNIEREDRSRIRWK